MRHAIAVVDIGKTRSKLSLWARDGRRLAERDHLNAAPAGDPARLDLAGIEAWLKRALAESTRGAEITAIVPVGHGAAGVLMDGDRPLAALDYEAEPPAGIAAAYDALRDPFEATLSPRLPGGLNLGAQLFWLEKLYPDVWPRAGQALLWAQYWAWVLCGERASEVTSLGCHTDLWRPLERRFSELASGRGWAERLGPLRHAGDVLGPGGGRWRPSRPAARLPRALRAARQQRRAARRARPARVGRRSVRRWSRPAPGWSRWRSAALAPLRTTRPRTCWPMSTSTAGRSPTARFMGGRDYEAWMGDALGEPGDAALLLRAERATDWTRLPPRLRAARAALELARRTDRALGLIAAEGPILIEGRFAADDAFAAALAMLRPGQPVHRSALADGVAAGALRLAAPDIAPAAPLERIRPGDLVAPRA